MMTTKFTNILVVTKGDQRQLARPLKPAQLEFLQADIWQQFNNFT